MKILLTAFDPFGGEEKNATEELLKHLPEPDKIELKKLVLPTVFYKSTDILVENIRAFSPDAVLCLGQAGGRSEITPERIGVNLLDARIPDNDGNQPRNCPMYEDGEERLFSTLPVDEIASAIRNNGIPSVVSEDAGRFVCNSLLYGALYHAGREFPDLRAGFIHIPFLPGQAERASAAAKARGEAKEYPSLPMESTMKAVLVALETIANGVS